MKLWLVYKSSDYTEDILDAIFFSADKAMEHCEEAEDGEDFEYNVVQAFTEDEIVPLDVLLNVDEPLKES